MRWDTAFVRMTITIVNRSYKYYRDIQKCTPENNRVMTASTNLFYTDDRRNAPNPRFLTAAVSSSTTAAT